MAWIDYEQARLREMMIDCGTPVAIMLPRRARERGLAREARKKCASGICAGGRTRVISQGTVGRLSGLPLLVSSSRATLYICVFL